MRRTAVFVIFAVLIVAAVAFFCLYKSLTGLAISSTYHYSYPGGKGITGGRAIQYPGAPEIYVYGSRIPAFLILGNAGIGDIGSCKNDLVWEAKISSPSDRFICFSVPQDGFTPLQPFNPWAFHGMRSDAFCYARTTGAEGQGIDSEKAVTEKILQVLVGKDEKAPWTEIYVVNKYGERRLVPVCGVSLQPLIVKYGR